MAKEKEKEKRDHANLMLTALARGRDLMQTCAVLLIRWK